MAQVRQLRKRQKSVCIQVKSMVALVDDIAATALQSMVKKLTDILLSF